MLSLARSMSRVVGMVSGEVGNYRLINQTRCALQSSILNDIGSKLPDCKQGASEDLRDELKALNEDIKKFDGALDALLNELQTIEDSWVGPTALQEVSSRVVSRIIKGSPRKTRPKAALQTLFPPPGCMTGYVQSPGGRKKIEDFLNSRPEFEGTYKTVDAFVDAADKTFDDMNASVAELDNMVNDIRLSGFINEHSKKRPDLEFSIFVVLNYENIKKHLF